MKQTIALLLQKMDDAHTAYTAYADTNRNFVSLLQILKNLGKLSSGDVENIIRAHRLTVTEAVQLAYAAGEAQRVYTPQIYSCISEKHNAFAKGYFPEEGSKSFIILSGSRTSDNMSRPFLEDEKGYGPLRQKLEHDGIIKDHLFTMDYKFSSSSAAAAVVLGHSASGPAQWKPIIS